MEGDFRHSQSLSTSGPALTDRRGPDRAALEIGEKQGIVGELTKAEPHAKFELLLAILAQGLDQDVGQGEGATTGLGFRRLKAHTVIGLLQRLLDHELLDFD